jgi:hypothetical protein
MIRKKNKKKKKTKGEQEDDMPLNSYELPHN